MFTFTFRISLLFLFLSFLFFFFFFLDCLNHIHSTLTSIELKKQNFDHDLTFMTVKSSGIRNEILELWDADLELTSYWNAVICLHGVLSLYTNIT